MKITNITHTFRSTPSKRRLTNEIVIHHQAGNEMNARQIHEMHRMRKTDSGSYWIGIAYHFVVLRSGEIQTGRPIDTVGAHAGATANGRSIGIMLTGDLDRYQPTQAQVDSLVWLIQNHLFPIYGKIAVSGHKQHMSTSCPGRFFPMDKVQSLIQSTGSRLVINGRTVNVPVENRNGRILFQVAGENGMVWVQARGLTDALGGSISWDGNTNTATIKV